MGFQDFEISIKMICFKILIDDLFQICIHLKNRINFFLRYQSFDKIMKKIQIAYVPFKIA